MKETIMLPVDKELLEQFEAVCAEIGLTAEKAIELFFEAVIRDKNILIEMIEDAEDIAVYEETMAEFKKKPVTHPFSELVDELGLNENQREA